MSVFRLENDSGGCFTLRGCHVIDVSCANSPLTDDTPVASAKGPPGDGVGQGREEADGTGRLWRTVIIGEQEQRIDMQAIRPYLRVVTHGGQSDTGRVRSRPL